MYNSIRVQFMNVSMVPLIRRDVREKGKTLISPFYKFFVRVKRR